MKKLYALLVISLIANAVLIYARSVETPFFGHQHLFDEYFLTVSGVLNFSDPSENSENLVQYFKFHCYEKKCTLQIASMSDRKNIFLELFEPEIIKLSYSDKIAVLKDHDCVFTLTADSATFNCGGKKTGTIEDDIHLHYQKHSFF